MQSCPQTRAPPQNTPQPLRTLDHQKVSRKQAGPSCGHCVHPDRSHQPGQERKCLDPPSDGPPQRLLGRRLGLVLTYRLCSLPSRAVRPLPGIRVSLPRLPQWPGPPPPLTSLPLIHCQPWLTGAGVWRGLGGWFSPVVTLVPRPRDSSHGAQWAHPGPGC